MKKPFKPHYGHSIILIVLSLFIGLVVLIGFNKAMDKKIESSYKQGQIDAVLGNMHYELVTESDHTSHWEKRDSAVHQREIHPY